MEDKHQTISQIIQFLHESSLYLNSHITEVYKKDYLLQFDEEWFAELLNFSYSEFLYILNFIDKVFFIQIHSESLRNYL